MIVIPLSQIDAAFLHRETPGTPTRRQAGRRVGTGLARGVAPGPLAG